jgi:hypothetical protein
VHGSGRARKGYRRGTYDLRDVSVELDGGRIDARGDCHVDVRVDDTDGFRMKLGPCGFAGWADLRVHAARQATIGGEQK